MLTAYPKNFIGKFLSKAPKLKKWLNGFSKEPDYFFLQNFPIASAAPAAV